MSTSTFSLMNVRDLRSKKISWGGSDRADYVWWDERFPFDRTRQGANSKPDYDETNLGLLFPQNNTGEIVYIIAQFNHDWVLGSELHPHIHFIQTSAQLPVFKMAYRWYENGSAVPAEFTTIQTDGVVFPYTSGSILQIASFPYIDGSSITTLSSMMDIKIYRDDNVVTGDVLVKEFDIHYPRDAPGSYSEFVKYP